MIDNVTNGFEVKETPYLSLYSNANKAREIGDLESARITYNEAHSAVDVHSSDKEDQWSRCASLDMVVRCETDLQVSSHEVIETMCKYASEIEKIYSSIHDDKPFEVPLNPRSASEITAFLRFVEGIPEADPNLLDEDTIKKHWLLYYYISRWAFVMRIYFVRCTSQLDLADHCGILSEHAAEKARKWRNHTGELVENADFVLKKEIPETAEGLRKRLTDIFDEVCGLMTNEVQPLEDIFIKKLAGVQDWADAHSKIQIALKFMTEGDYAEAAKAFLPIEKEIKKMEYTGQLGEEYEFQLKAKKYYAHACISEDNYEASLADLRLLFLTSFIRFPKIAREIKIFEARAALRYSKLDDAMNAYKIAKVQFAKVEEDQDGILNGWLDLIEAQIALLNHKNPDTPEKDTKSLSEAFKGKIVLVCNKLGGLCPEFILNKVQSGLSDILEFEDVDPLKIEDIKSKFKAYTIEDSVISRPPAEYLPLEAQRLFVLGMVEIEQIRDEYDHQKYLNGVAYLLNAYSILLELESKDKHLLKQIEDSFKELSRINFTNSRFSEEQIVTILQNLNMEEVAKRNQLEQWTKALLKIMSEQKLTSQEDCEDDFSVTLARIIPQFISSASNVQLIKQNELPKWKLKPNDEYSMIQEGTVKKDGKEIFVTTLSLNTNDEFDSDDHTIVIESAYELTRYTKGSLMMIATALEKALKIHSLYKNSEGGIVEDRQRLYDLSGPLTDTLLDEATIEHKKRIQEFMRVFCGEWNREQNGMPFDIDLLINAARHHDTGKAGTPLIVLLKEGALNNQEYKIIMQHPEVGADRLLGLLKLDPVVKYEFAHHVQEGNRRGYPCDLKGNRYQNEIHEFMAEYLKSLTEEERAFLMSTTETLEGKRNKDMGLMSDILEAMSAESRTYRDKLTLKKLVGFATSNIGINFPHYLIHAFVRYVNKGLFNDFISHGEIPNGVKNKFELPVSYKLDAAIEYMESLGEKEFTEIYEIDYNSSLRGLSAGKGCGVAISRECIRAEMFGMYMRTFKIDQKETKKRYGKRCDDYVKGFVEWAKNNGEQPVDDYYGAQGYPSK